MTEPTLANLRAQAVVDRRKANWPDAKHTGRMAGYLPELRKGGIQTMSPEQTKYYNETMIVMGWPEKVEKPKWRRK